MFLYLFYIHRLHSQFFFPLRLIGVSRCPFRCILLNFCKQFEELKQLNISPHSPNFNFTGVMVQGCNYMPMGYSVHCGASESRYRLFWKPYCQYRGDSQTDRAATPNTDSRKILAVSEQERQEPLCLSCLGVPFRHSRNRAILGHLKARGIITLWKRLRGVQRRYTACMNVLNVNVNEIAKSRLEFKKLFNLFQSLFNLQ